MVLTENFLGDASQVAALEGRFTVHAGETSAGNEAAMGWIDRIRDAYKKYMTADVNTLTPAEAKVRLAAYEAVKKEAHQRMDIDRNVILVKLAQAAVRARKVKGKFFAAPWGRAHDLGPEVEDFNRTVQLDEQLGVLWFTAKDKE